LPIYIVDKENRLLGAISLHDVKTFLDRPELEIGGYRGGYHERGVSAPFFDAGDERSAAQE
jgi:hypothetical protein